ncbi:MAG TPA: NAD(P)-dependent oxidoreductase [Vicinamibacterales bacterium]|jgi:nucleoside-diphosphate-sugar epimerase|nr:NAD(P)-dependent oxidoreductase [Vicinamibacterales bacterium]
MGTLPDAILITGAAGWLGTNLLHGLAAQATATELHVRCLVLPGERVSTPPGLRVDEIVGNVADTASLPAFAGRADGGVLFHLAGIIHPPRVRDFYTINHEGTVNVMNAARAAGIRRAVVISSNSPFGANPSPAAVFDERSPYHPYLNYGRSKMLMEEAVLAANEPGRFETVILRPPWYYGPYQPPRQTLFFQMVRRGGVPMFGGGENRRSMAYTGNVVDAMLLAATVPAAAGQAYWVGDVRPYPMREIVGTIERLLAREFGRPCKGRQMKLPHAAAATARMVDAVMQRVGMYQQKIHVLGEMDETIACSVEKARRELGYAPAIALEEGMRRSIRWCLDAGQEI